MNVFIPVHNLTSKEPKDQLV